MDFDEFGWRLGRKINLEEIDRFAEEAHSGQKYGKEEAYINHPRRVASKLEHPLLKAVALLHDVVEDTSVTLADVRRLFGEQIAEGVNTLTRREGEVYFINTPESEDYIHRVSISPVARKVKIADLQENLYFAESVNKEYSSLIPRYKKALEFLLRVEKGNK